MKFKFPSCVTRGILVLLNNDKVSELHNSGNLFSLTIPSNEKPTKN